MLIVRQKGGGSFAIRLGNVTLDRVRRVFCRGRLQPQWRSSLQWSLHTQRRKTGQSTDGHLPILQPSSGLLFHLPSTLVNRKALLVLCLLQKTAPRSKSRTGNPSLLKELGRCCTTSVTAVTNFKTPRSRQVFLKSRPMCSGSAVTLTCSLYLNDSMPFFVDLTKNGCLSILVMWTRPPLLSMAPEWIAALQILDCWEHNSTSVGNTSGTNATNNKWRPDSPHRRKDFPTLSLSYSCNWQDIYTCRRTNMSSCPLLKNVRRQ